MLWLKVFCAAPLLGTVLESVIPLLGTVLSGGFPLLGTVPKRGIITF